MRIVVDQKSEMDTVLTHATWNPQMVSDMAKSKHKRHDNVNVEPSRGRSSLRMLNGTYLVRTVSADLDFS